MDASALQLLIPIAGIVAILFAIYLARDVLSRDTGTEAMQEVAGTIFEGAVAFIRRQYTTIFVLAIVGAVIIGIVITLVETPEVADVPKLAGVPIGLMFVAFPDRGSLQRIKRRLVRLAEGSSAS